MIVNSYYQKFLHFYLLKKNDREQIFIDVWTRIASLAEKILDNLYEVYSLMLRKILTIFEYFFYEGLADSTQSKIIKFANEGVEMTKYLQERYKKVMLVERFLKIEQRSVNLFHMFNLVRHSNNATLSTSFAKLINTPLALCQHAPLSTHRVSSVIYSTPMSSTARRTYGLSWLIVTSLKRPLRHYLRVNQGILQLPLPLEVEFRQTFIVWGIGDTDNATNTI